MTYHIFPGVPAISQRPFQTTQTYTPNDLIYTICKFHNIGVQKMADPIRKREIVQTRQIAMYFIRKRFSLSLKEIGKYFGNRDHSTVIHGIKTVNDLYKTDRSFRESFEHLTMLINDKYSNKLPIIE